MLNTNLNALPTGLLGLLDIKSGGKYPGQLVDALAPVLDMLDWYASAQSEFVYGSGQYLVNTAVGTTLIPSTLPTNYANGTTWAVPNGEVYYVQSARIDWTLNTATTESALALVAISPTGNGDVPITQKQAGYTVGNAVARGGRSSSVRPILLMPGTQIAIRNFGSLIGTGNVDYAWTLRVARFRA